MAAGKQASNHAKRPLETGRGEAKGVGVRVAVTGRDKASAGILAGLAQLVEHLRGAAVRIPSDGTPV